MRKKNSELATWELGLIALQGDLLSNVEQHLNNAPRDPEVGQEFADRAMVYFTISNSPLMPFSVNALQLMGNTYNNIAQLLSEAYGNSIEI